MLFKELFFIGGIALFTTVASQDYYSDDYDLESYGPDGRKICGEACQKKKQDRIDALAAKAKARADAAAAKAAARVAAAAKKKAARDAAIAAKVAASEARNTAKAAQAKKKSDARAAAAAKKKAAKDKRAGADKLAKAKKKADLVAAKAAAREAVAAAKAAARKAAADKKQATRDAAIAKKAADKAAAAAKKIADAAAAAAKKIADAEKKADDKLQSSLKPIKINPTDICKGGWDVVRWSNSGEPEKFMAGKYYHEETGGKMWIGRPDGAPCCGGYILAVPPKRSYFIELWFEPVYNIQSEIKGSAVRATGFPSWCDMQGSGSGSGDGMSDYQHYMGEATVKYGSVTPDKVPYYYCWDPNATCPM